MEALFDNKTNIVNARICAKLDGAVMYSVQTKFDFHGRILTILRDENPVKGTSAVVGAIYWKEKSFEISGKRKKIQDLKRSEGSLFRKRKFWRWSARRTEYEMSYTHEEWKATIEGGRATLARFCVPFRPHLFSKCPPPVVHLTSTALAEDEVFLLLLFIYVEVKRQDTTNTSTSGGTGSW